MVNYVFTDEFNGQAGSPPDTSKWFGLWNYVEANPGRCVRVFRYDRNGILVTP